MIRKTVGRYKSGAILLLLRYVGHLPSHVIRLGLYRILGLQAGKRTVIYGGAEIRAPRKITIDDDTIIGHDAILDGRGKLTIGKNVNIGTGVWIWTMQHDPQAADFATIAESVSIEDYAWISCRVIILPGVKIAEGCAIAAGAVVTKSTEPYGIYGGVPAKRIGERNSSLIYSLGKFLPTPFI